MIDQLTKAGPTLVFDSGNALFAFEGPQDEGTKPRARFILDAMGKLGTKVMAAGAKDLNFGAAWLKEAAAPSGVKILSANLTDHEKEPFEGSAVVTVGKSRIGFIAVTQPGGLGDPGAKLVATDMIAAVKEELPKLKGKTDLVILLAAVKQADAFALSGAFKNDVDFIVTSSDSRGNQPAQKADGAWVVNPGARGQVVAVLSLKLDGKGAFVDLAEVDREKELLKSLDSRLAEMEPRMKAATDPKSKEMMKTTVDELKVRRAAQKKKADAGVAANARTFDYTFAVLDEKVDDDAPLKAEVLKYEPTYKGAH